MVDDASGGHAVIVGAGMAGLLAGWVLARRLGAVTVLERDGLDDTGAAARKGVPQGRHAHVLGAGGADAFAALFAAAGGFDFAAGATPSDPARDLMWFQFGVWKKRFESRLPTYWCDRPRLEGRLRERVAALDNVRLLAGRRATGLVADGGGAGRIVGVRMAAREGGGLEEELWADLVVDASGGGSRAPSWLEGLGYPRAREDVVRIDVGYASRVYRRTAPAPGRDWTALAVYPRPPESRRAGLIYRLDGAGERWMVTLVGWVGDHPPGDEAGFLDFARSLPRDDVAAWLGDGGAEPVTDIRRHLFPANRWRRFELMRRWPEGFAAVGDAVCAFDPVYGQGMTVAALDALALDRMLGRRPGGDIRAPGFARRLQRELARHRATPWRLATWADLRFPEARGRRPFGLGALNWYTGHVLELAAEREAAHRRFLEVLGFRRPAAALFHPEVALPVLRRALRPRRRDAGEGAARG